jgi:hypothetical protein
LALLGTEIPEARDQEGRCLGFVPVRARVRPGSALIRSRVWWD